MTRFFDRAASGLFLPRETEPITSPPSAVRGFRGVAGVGTRRGGLGAGRGVTYAPPTIPSMLVGSFVSVDDNETPADGMTPNAVTVQLAARGPSGSYIPVAGFPANRIVVKLNGSTTGVTQPTGVSDGSGILSASVVTSVAGLNVVTAELDASEFLDTAEFTGNGTPPPPPSGSDPNYRMPHDAPENVRATVSGVSWQASNLVTVGAVPAGRSGYGLLFPYGPDAPGEDSGPEQRFTLPVGVTHFWIERWCYVPANYFHRTDTIGSSNNKETRLWGTDYSSLNKVGSSTRPGTPAGDSVIRYEYTHKDNPSSVSQMGHGPSGKQSTPVAFGTDAQRGTWVLVREEFGMVTAAQNDGVYRLWYGDTLVEEFLNIENKYDAARPYWDRGYRRGAGNSGFADLTVICEMEIGFWYDDNDPGWL